MLYTILYTIYSIPCCLYHRIHTGEPIGSPLNIWNLRCILKTPMSFMWMVTPFPDTHSKPQIFQSNIISIFNISMSILKMSISVFIALSISTSISIAIPKRSLCPEAGKAPHQGSLGVYGLGFRLESARYTWDYIGYVYRGY